MHFNYDYKLSKNTVIFGAGGHSKVVIEVIDKCPQASIVGIFDDFLTPDHLEFKHFQRYPLLGRIKDFTKYKYNQGIVAIGDNKIRREVVEFIRKKRQHFEFVSYHQEGSSFLSKSCLIGQGTVIMAGSSVNANAIVGNHCIINTNASIDHDCILKDYVNVSPNCGIGGRVTIGEGTFLGIGVNVLPDIHIGENCYIGAGSLVNRDIPDNSFGYGIPFRIIREEDNQKYKNDN